jgi:hypothetical protein
MLSAETLYNASRTLLAHPAVANGNFTSILSQASRTIESLFVQQSPAEEPVSWHTQLYNTVDRFLASRNSLENTSLLLALCTFVYLIMSWTSRLGNLGRFSPFTRSPPTGAAKVSDSDFSYITADDLRRHQQESLTGQQQSQSPTDYGSHRDTDMLVLRNNKKEFMMHFPAYSIVKGELKVGSVREAAGKKMNTSASTIKLLYKGKNLKDDDRQCKQEGLKDGSEILCVVAQGVDDDDGDSEEDGEESVEDGTVDGDTGKKRRNRGKRTKRRNRREAQAQDNVATSGTSTPERLGVPPKTSREPSRTSSPKPPPTPATPIDKLHALHETLRSFDKEVQAFIDNPPAEKSKKDYDHKRLSETILTQVLLKTDAVETEGDPEARTKRKELVKETQEQLSRLDEAVKR